MIDLGEPATVDVMLDALFIFRKNGSVLWQQVWEALKTNPINDVIHSALLESHAAATFYQDATYTAKWSVDDEFDVVIVAVYQRFLDLSYIDELLVQCKVAFCNLLQPMSEDERDNAFPCLPFTPIFVTIENDLKQRIFHKTRSRVAIKPRSLTEINQLAGLSGADVSGERNGSMSNSKEYTRADREPKLTASCANETKEAAVVR